jgi:hypothetical protein
VIAIVDLARGGTVFFSSVMAAYRRELKLPAVDVCWHARPKTIVDLLRIDAAVVRVVVNAMANEKLTAFWNSNPRFAAGLVGNQLVMKICRRAGQPGLTNDHDCPGPLAKPFRVLATQFAPQGSQAEQSATEQRNC